MLRRRYLWFLLLFFPVVVFAASFTDQSFSTNAFSTASFDFEAAPPSPPASQADVLPKPVINGVSMN